MNEPEVKTEETKDNDELLNLMKDLKDEFKKVSDSNDKLEKRLNKLETSYLNEEQKKEEKPKKKTMLEILRSEQNEQ